MSSLFHDQCQGKNYIYDKVNKKMYPRFWTTQKFNRNWKTFGYEKEKFHSETNKRTLIHESNFKPSNHSLYPTVNYLFEKKRKSNFYHLRPMPIKILRSARNLKSGWKPSREQISVNRFTTVCPKLCGIERMRFPEF